MTILNNSYHKFYDLQYILEEYSWAVPVQKIDIVRSVNCPVLQ
jgi:hypothetical protein